MQGEFFHFHVEYGKECGLVGGEASCSSLSPDVFVAVFERSRVQIHEMRAIDMQTGR
jgi:hypothetical protein